MTDVVKKRSKIEQEKYELELKKNEDPPIDAGPRKRINLKDYHESSWAGTDFGSLFTKRKSKLQIEKEAFIEAQRELREKSMIDNQ